MITTERAMTNAGSTGRATWKCDKSGRWTGQPNFAQCVSSLSRLKQLVSITHTHTHTHTHYGLTVRKLYLDGPSKLTF